MTIPKFGPDAVVVCATDFSEASQPALDATTSLCQRLGVSSMHLLYVDETLDRFAGVTEVDSRFVAELTRLQEEARTVLAKLATEVSARGVVAHTVYRVGVAHTEIGRFAEEIKADLLVLGSHGRTGIKRWVMGSVAERVVRHAPCSVLTVRLPA
jgi:nucleotide-binding universal stress UspA family protein